MKKSLFSIVTASMIVAGASLASAQTTTTTTTWTTDQGAAITDYSTTQKYVSFSNPNMQPAVGFVLPGTVTVYPIPTTMNVPNATLYNYGLINGDPVIVDRTTRKVIHTWN